MYSYEDRIRAVKLYIKLGKRTSPTIRQLGYPTKTALKNWYREYQQNRALQVGYVRLRQKYSDEQKQVAVQHYLDHDRCIASTMRVLGYPCRQAFTAWIEELHPEVRTHVVGKVANVQYSPELKNAAVLELGTRQTSAQAIAQKRAVSRPTLYNWKNQLLGREASPSSMKRQNNSKPVPEQTELQQQVETLQRDIRRLQLEQDLLKKANELLKKALGVDLQLLGNREKTLLVDALKQVIRCQNFWLRVPWPVALIFIIGSNSAVRTNRLMPVLPHRSLRVQSPLLRLSADACRTCQAPATYLGEGGTTFDEAGMPGGRGQQKASVWILPRRNQPSTREPY